MQRRRSEDAALIRQAIDWAEDHNDIIKEDYTSCLHDFADKHEAGEIDGQAEKS